MKQSIERTAFEASSMDELITKLNEFTASVSVGNVMDTTIETRMTSTDIKKYEGVTGEFAEINGKLEGTDRYKQETEFYNYVYIAIVTVLKEE